MKVCFDGLRITLADSYNEIARLIKTEVKSGNIDNEKDILEHLENMREIVGTILILEDEHGEFSSLISEMKTLEVAEVSR